MAKVSYADKLKDPRWQRKRLEIFERDNWECKSCGEKTRMLAVHHRLYERGKEPWDYPDYCLVTLCDECHAMESEGMHAATHNLIEACAYQGFLSSDILSLAAGIGQMRHVSRMHSSEVTASILEWGLQNKAVMEVMVDAYWADLESRGPKNGGDTDVREKA